MTRKKHNKVRPMVAELAGEALASDETREKIVRALDGIKDQTIETYHQVNDREAKGSKRSKK